MITPLELLVPITWAAAVLSVVIFFVQGLKYLGWVPDKYAGLAAVVLGVLLGAVVEALNVWPDLAPYVRVVFGGVAIGLVAAGAYSNRHLVGIKKPDKTKIVPAPVHPDNIPNVTRGPDGKFVAKGKAASPGIDSQNDQWLVPPP